MQTNNPKPEGGNPAESGRHDWESGQRYQCLNRRCVGFGVRHAGGVLADGYHVCASCNGPMARATLDPEAPVSPAADGHDRISGRRCDWAGGYHCARPATHMVDEWVSDQRPPPSWRPLCETHLRSVEECRKGRSGGFEARPITPFDDAPPPVEWPAELAARITRALRWGAELDAQPLSQVPDFALGCRNLLEAMKLAGMIGGGR